jgi:putative membrane protein
MPVAAPVTMAVRPLRSWPAATSRAVENIPKGEVMRSVMRGSLIWRPLAGPMCSGSHAGNQTRVGRPEGTTMLDLVLAILHHILAFGLVAMLTAESVLVKPGMTGETVRRVAGIDAGYGLCSVLLIVVGVARVILAAKGWAYYQDNIWFWAKMATFLAVGLLSAPPTIRSIRWRKQFANDAGWRPSDAEIAGVRRWIALEMLGLALIIVFAATMARYQGMPE